MSEFTDLENWNEHIGGIDYLTTKELSWEVGRVGSGIWVTVPAGFPFNASVPWVMRWLISPHEDRLLKISALHDYGLYELRWHRVAAAALFSEASRALGFGKWSRLVMVYGVIGWNWK